MRRGFGPVLAASMQLAACAASPRGAATTAPTREIMVEEAAVVQVPRPGGEAAGEHPGLPPLPQALPHTSEAFQKGYSLATQLLQAPGPSAPPVQDVHGSEVWLVTQFKPWFEQRQLAILALVDAFAEMAPAGEAEPAHEHVVAIALVGLAAGRTYDQLVSVPPPPDLQADERLARIYRSELQTVLLGMLEQSILAHRRCAERAAEQRELAFGGWLELCHQQLAARSQQHARALELRDAVSAEREAARRQAEGTRPPGPDICWAPSQLLASPETAALQAPAPVEPSASGTLAPAPAPAANAARACALPADWVDPLDTQPQSPRDLRYGARDPETGVRVSVALKDNPTMDAQPLAFRRTQAQLARCFATHVPRDLEITIAVHANLTVDARGRTQAVILAPEPSDASPAPGRALERCLSQALRAVDFTCSPSGQTTQARASFCLRRD